MRYKIEELKDISDSIEIMQSSPKRFGKNIIYLVITLLTLSILWSFYAKKEIAIDVTGEIRPTNNEINIVNNIPGIVNNIYFKDGDKVKAGDLLLELDNSEYKSQIKLLEDKLNKYEKDLNNTYKLINSIYDGINYFTENEDEKDYYNKYEVYNASLKDITSQNNLITTQKEDLQSSLNDYNLLIKSIEDNINYLNNSSVLYYTYEDYSIVINDYNRNIKKLEEELNYLITTTDLDEQTKSEQINSIESNLEDTKIALEKYKNSQNSTIYTSIDSIKSKIIELELSAATSNLKEQYISQLESTVQTLEDTITELKGTIESYNKKINDTLITAESDGYINMTAIIHQGEYLQTGTQIALLVPGENDKLKVNLYIKNEDIGDIKNGQLVNIEIIALPKSEYGLIKSNISNISTDSKLDSQTGISYYSAEAIIDNNFLTDKNGSKISIKLGMLAKGKIIKRRISYFRYFLELLNIIN